MPRRSFLKRFLVGVVFLVVFFGWLARHDRTKRTPETSSGEWRRVVRVVDGDTLLLDRDERVRLIGVDTPESVAPNRPVEYFGKQASDFTRRKAEGRRVRLEYDWQRNDKYGRTLAYIYLDDGTFLNAEIIRQGYGHAYTKYPFRQAEAFRAYERIAREEQRGLWAPP